MSKTPIFLDIEVYKNYFLATFMQEDGRAKMYEIFNGDASAFPSDEIFQLMQRDDIELITFNGNHYDIPLLTLTLLNRGTYMAKRESDRIIRHNVRPWHFYRDNGLREPKLNHVDLIEVAPGRVSLKLYGGRMHTQRLQELPVDHTATITEEQRQLLRRYCKNDTMVTRDLYRTLSKQLELRRSMSERYGVDLLSKSDAQIAEAVLKTEFHRVTGEWPPKVTPTYKSFFYEAPSYVAFRTESLRRVLETVTSAEMVLNDDTGHVEMPKAISSLKIEIGNSSYNIGIGGLHSQESEVAHFADDANVLIDRDVASYYPNLMLNMGMQVGGFGEQFNPVYRRILTDRLAAKRRVAELKAQLRELEGAENRAEIEAEIIAIKDEIKQNETLSDSYKLSLNGTFGKTSSKYSTIYSPKFMIQTTLSGQLSLLMLIEVLELVGIPVVSANTDGVVIKCPRDRLGDLDQIITKWEKRTGLETEETRYAALYSRDVNNYIAVKDDGSVKRKGVFGEPGLSKNPQNTICAEAVVAHLTEGVEIFDHVRGCRDIRKFLTLRTVTGGAVKDGEPIGKAIRWYYSDGESGTINYATNGNTVPKSFGAKPVMDLPEKFPSDVDYDWYIRECDEIMMAIGARRRPVMEKIPRKNSKAWKELRDSGRIVEQPDGKKWVWAEGEGVIG